MKKANLTYQQKRYRIKKNFRKIELARAELRILEMPTSLLLKQPAMALIPMVKTARARFILSCMDWHCKVRDVVALGKEGLLNIRMCGKKTADEFERVFTELGLC